MADGLYALRNEDDAEDHWRLRRYPRTLLAEEESLDFFLRARQLVDLDFLLVEEDFDLPDPLLHQRSRDDDQMRVTRDLGFMLLEPRLRF